MAIGRGEPLGDVAMMKTLLVAAGLAALAGAPTPAGAQPRTQPLADGRPCAYADLVGLWESQAILSNEIGVESRLARVPRTYMRFSADGGMIAYGQGVYRSAGRPETDLATIQKALDGYDDRFKLAYQAQMPSPGLLLYRRAGLPIQGFTCTVVDPQAGKPAFLLTQLKGGPPVRRIQHRLD